ncbi:MAG: O-antigen ligase family protein [Leptospirillum sp.]
MKSLSVQVRDKIPKGLERKTPFLDFSIPFVPWPYYAITIVLGFDAFFSIGIPRLVLLPLSAVLFISLAIKSVGSPLPAMMALIVYIPYAKAVAGNMGGFLPGLNYTTALMFIVILGMYSRVQGTQMETPLPLEAAFRRQVIFFCVVGAISVIHTDVVFAGWSVFTAIVDYKRWVDPFLVFFLFSYLVRTREEGKVLIYLMAVSMVVVGIGSLYEHHALAERSHRIRLKGIAGQANQMGAFYANYMFLILGFLWMKGLSSVKKSVFALGFWGCLLGLFATESRGDALALVVGMLVFFFLKNRLLFFGVIAGIAFLAVNIQFLPSGLRARIQHTVVHRDPYGFSHSSGQLDASARTRLALWQGAANMIISHPILGVGYKMFPEYIFQYVPHNEETARLPLSHRDGHNAYLMIGAEMGVPALLLFLILLLFMFRIMWRAYRAAPDPFWKTVSVCGLCAMSSLVLTNMFGSRVISLVLAGYLWALLAILLKVPKWAKEGDPKEVKAA